MSDNHTYTAKEIIGVDVKNFSDEDLGKIEDIAISPEGSVEYVVLSHGGIMGTTLNDEQYAIPYDTLIWDDNEECIRIDISTEFIEETAGFDKENRPDLADVRFKDEVDIHYPKAHSQ